MQFSVDPMTGKMMKTPPEPEVQRQTFVVGGSNRVQTVEVDGGGGDPPEGDDGYWDSLESSWDDTDTNWDQT